MAVMSTDLATTFLGFAKRHAAIATLRLRPALLAPARAPSHRALTRVAAPSISVRMLKSKAATRRFTASAASTTEENSDVMTKIPPDDRIPATIITGFLGSGKTTLLNHILTADHGKRIAVIENEYGEIDIDGSLVAAKTTGAEDIIMLNNGCLCCTVRGDLVRMISELVAKKKGKFDHIVIETTDRHLDEVKPKGVVNEAVEQIAYADRIIVNKTDLVGESEISSLVQRIKTINSMANLKRTEYGRVELDYVLGIGGFDLERIETVVNEEGSKEEHSTHDHEHSHHDGHHHDDHHHHHHEHDHKHDDHTHDHVHDPGVSSVSIVCEGNLDLEKANMWLGTLLMERSDDIYRMKGLLSVDGMPERFVFQGVHDIFQGSPDRLWGSNEPRINKIVFIGKNLDGQELEKGFKACLL
ncbi:P-loop containing nucleoside triphosphate hydrolase protein [Dioscorea alata]|uniref:P-loop containing nucleoside triphosphate hydrolase protein n=1 Tax=Dioscorea alata TaxID=55571 RepID=A0ACB7VLR4_DIOAL|nr:P-loop containing nucleoside triphosphate hydrolase protein [Dioscorea alata]